MGASHPQPLPMQQRVRDSGLDPARLNLAEYRRSTARTP